MRKIFALVVAGTVALLSGTISGQEANEVYAVAQPTVTGLSEVE